MGIPRPQRIEEESKLARIEKYIEKRKENLRTFLTEERPELWEEAKRTKLPARDVRKVLWWEQELVSSEDRERGE